MFKIGIIGCGFVGSAVAAGFSLHADIKIYDKNRPFDTLLDVCRQDMIFLCVPTPMQSNGVPDMSYIHEALQTLKYECDQAQQDSKIVIIKSTVLPGTNRKLQQQYPNFIFISNPEFLTARAARLDFINASRIILGGENREAILQVAELYNTIKGHTPIFVCSWEEAEFTKYMNNCFFALKISFMNEMYFLAQLNQLNFDNIKTMWLADGRIGNSHTDVPGHDGDFGFGGTCLPKDLAAFIQWARSQRYVLRTLEAAQMTNNIIRKKRDWQISDSASQEQSQ